MDPLAPAASDSNNGAVVLRKPEHRALLSAPPPSEALRGPGLTVSRIADRIGNSILRPIEKKLFQRVGPNHWKSHIENLFGHDKEREKALGELHGNPNCSSGRLKPLGSYCHALLKLARPGDTTVNTQLITFKILVAMITRYPGVRRTLHADKELRRVSATDPSLRSVWKRPHQDCGEEWSFYRNFVVFCISHDAFKLTKLVETEPPHRLSRITSENWWDKVPIEELLGHAGDGPEFHFSRLCAIRYLAGILELPSFWRGFKRAEQERQRFLDVLLALCTTILQLLEDSVEDSGGNAADMSVGPSPSMDAGRTAVEVLSCSLLYGLCQRVRDLNNLPPRGPLAASLGKIVSILLRDKKSFERAFEPAKEVNSLFDSSPTSPHDDEDPSDAPDTETASGAARRVSPPGGDDPSDAHDTEQASGPTDRVSRPGGKDPSDVHNTETASGAADRVSPPGRDDPLDAPDTEQASGATDRVSRLGGKDPSDTHDTEQASGAADRVSPPGGDDPSDMHDTEQASGAADRVSRLGGKDRSDTHDTEQASGAADRVSPPGRDGGLGQAMKLPKPDILLDETSMQNGAYLESPKMDPGSKDHSEGTGGVLRPLIESHSAMRPTRETYSDVVRGGTQGHRAEVPHNWQGQSQRHEAELGGIGGSGGTGQGTKFPKPLIFLDDDSKSAFPSITGAYFCSRFKLGEEIQRLLEKNGFNEADGLLHADEFDLKDAGFQFGHIAELKWALKKIALETLGRIEDLKERARRVYIAGGEGGAGGYGDQRGGVGGPGGAPEFDQDLGFFVRRFSAIGGKWAR